MFPLLCGITDAAAVSGKSPHNLSRKHTVRKKLKHKYHQYTTISLTEQTVEFQREVANRRFNSKKQIIEAVVSYHQLRWAKVALIKATTVNKSRNQSHQR